MKTPLIVFLLALNAFSAEPTTENLVSDSKRAIATLQSNHKLNSVLLGAKPRPTDFQAKWKKLHDERADCYARLQALQADIKIDSSVFDYPGLLALGKIGYGKAAVGGHDKNETPEAYFLKIHDGYSDCSDGSSETRYYVIQFDGIGKVISKGRAPRMLE
jgi:hypothetical protein